MAKKFWGGLALGALVGSALGLFLSPGKGKENRVKFKKIALKVSEELVDKVSKLSQVSQKEYEAIVENIIKKYSKDDLMSTAAWRQIGEELKARWADIQKEFKQAKPKKK